MLTGTLVGPRHVLTNSHCIQEDGVNYFTPDVNFYPAQEGPNSSTPIPWINATFSSNCCNEKNLVSPGYDYAMVFLSERVGDPPRGFMPLPADGECTDGVYAFTLVGYPSDLLTSNTSTAVSITKATDLTEQYQYQSVCDNVTIACASTNRFEHTCDTVAGMSGSPIFRKTQDASRPFVMYAIHSAGQLGRGTC